MGKGSRLRQGKGEGRPEASLCSDQSVPGEAPAVRKSGVGQLLTRGQRFLWRSEEQEVWHLGLGEGWVRGAWEHRGLGAWPGEPVIKCQISQSDSLPVQIRKLRPVRDSFAHGHTTLARPALLPAWSDCTRIAEEMPSRRGLGIAQQCVRARLL